MREDSDGGIGWSGTLHIILFMPLYNIYFPRKENTDNDKIIGTRIL
jgi:hypothetical protein